MVAKPIASTPGRNRRCSGPTSAAPPRPPTASHTDQPRRDRLPLQDHRGDQHQRRTDRVQGRHQYDRRAQDRITPDGADTATVSPARAAEFRDRLATLMHDMVDGDYGEDGVPIHFLAVFYALTD
jgi:hypothetical protein